MVQNEGSDQVALQIYLERRPMFFFWKIVFPLFIITTTMLASWLFEVDEFEQRLAVLLTLLLTGKKILVGGFSNLFLSNCLSIHCKFF